MRKHLLAATVHTDNEVFKAKVVRTIRADNERNSATIITVAFTAEIRGEAGFHWSEERAWI